VSVMDPQMGAPILRDGTTQVDPAEVTNALLNAIHQAALRAASDSSGQEGKDWALAALNLAQAVVVLDPSLSQGGSPLAHDVAIKAMEGETQKAVAAIQGETQVRVAHVTGEHALRQANAKAQAPSPAKKKTATVRRDGSGRATSYEVSES
jgi:hypothetical protein